MHSVDLSKFFPVRKWNNYEEMIAYRNKILHIKNFKDDGFEKVCDVKEEYYYNRWCYTNINKELMFDTHRSWVYAITLDDVIVKLGETGNPLGIKMSDGQPKLGSQCRLGRYRNGDGTDDYIRRELHDYLHDGHRISFWAKKCPIKMLSESIAGESIKVANTIHKSLEAAYLQYFEDSISCLPMLNKSRK
jgi:hypothetical protein